MQRSRLRKGIPFKVWLIAVLALGAGGAFGWRQWVRGAEPFKDIRPLEMNAYLERPATLRGSVFTVRATVQQTLASSAESGRLILVMTMVPRDSRDAPEPLPRAGAGGSGGPHADGTTVCLQNPRGRRRGAAGPGRL